MKYDYLIVGSGLFAAVFAQKMLSNGKTILIVERRPHIGGNVYTENVEGINVHKYGAHIFRTDLKEIWDYVNQFADFNRFTNSPIANYYGEIYSLPFNMYTFNKMWGVSTPLEAKEIIEKQKKEYNISKITNLEEHAISLVGSDIFNKLIKGYTEKQWGRNCNELPPSIMKRIPVRFTYDNNYFTSKYQGVPIQGYTKIIENMLNGADVVLNTDYLKNKNEFQSKAKKILFTGPIDEYFDFVYGSLEYRTVTFKEEKINIDNYQGNAVVNYTDRETPWTRIIEHKWFNFGKDENGKDIPCTIISREYPSEWKPGDEPFYPVNDSKNNSLYLKYKELAQKEKNVIFGGRLGEYRYYDMEEVIIAASKLVKEELKN